MLLVKVGVQNSSCPSWVVMLGVYQVSCVV